jgi:competence protein ComEA
MRWLYRLQHRLSLTGAECAALLVAVGALVAGLAVRQIQAHRAPPAAALYAEADERFAALDRAATDSGGADALAAVPLLAVPAPGEPALRLDEAAPAPGAGGGTAPTGPVADAPRRAGRGREARPAPGSIDLNTAGPAELERLPRIGPALAARIVEYRRQHGPFRRVEELENVRGIGPRIREQIAPFARL